MAVVSLPALQSSKHTDAPCNRLHSPVAVALALPQANCWSVSPAMWQEPTKHQYDWDAATTMGFLHQYGLDKEFALNIECNHATLAGHSCDHELQVWGSRPLLMVFKWACILPCCQPHSLGMQLLILHGQCQ